MSPIPYKHLPFQQRGYPLSPITNPKGFSSSVFNLNSINTGTHPDAINGNNFCFVSHRVIPFLEQSRSSRVFLFWMESITFQCDTFSWENPWHTWIVRTVIRQWRISCHHLNGQWVPHNRLPILRSSIVMDGHHNLLPCRITIVRIYHWMYRREDSWCHRQPCIPTVHSSILRPCVSRQLQDHIYRPVTLIQVNCRVFPSIFEDGIVLKLTYKMYQLFMHLDRNDKYDSNYGQKSDTVQTQFKEAIAGSQPQIIFISS